MLVKRVQVEDGFLDGVDLSFAHGLNVIIGARGTGKTSIIELIRFCLGVPGHTHDTSRRSREHALSVLGGGQVSVTLTDGVREVLISRTATDESPRASEPFEPPIIFSQTEIESVGLEAGGRLRLIDEFVQRPHTARTAERILISQIASNTSRIGTLRREIEEFDAQLAGAADVNAKAAEVALAEASLAALSEEASEKTRQLDSLSESITADGVMEAQLNRHAKYAEVLSTTLSSTQTTSRPPPLDSTDPRLVSVMSRFQRSRALVREALAELEEAQSAIAEGKSLVSERRSLLEDQARQLRREIELIQAGAGNTIRQAHALRERRALLESVRQIRTERGSDLQKLIADRAQQFSELEKFRSERFEARAAAADELNRALGPRIHITVVRGGQQEDFESALTDSLRGSGLKYGDLGPLIAREMSPRELVEVIETSDEALLRQATGISRERAQRIIAHLRDADLASFATLDVEDSVRFELLDGSVRKDFAELSTGQRCTVVLPLTLSHPTGVLIVDQPEDHIDNAFIVETLIRAILSRDKAGQMIFSTHNANIPVLGEAAKLVQMSSDGRHGFIAVSGGLNEPEVVVAITSVMEGGAEAFARRALFYQRHA